MTCILYKQKMANPWILIRYIRWRGGMASGIESKTESKNALDAITAKCAKKRIFEFFMLEMMLLILLYIIILKNQIREKKPCLGFCYFMKNVM